MFELNFILPMVILIGLVIGLYWFVDKFTKNFKN